MFATRDTFSATLKSVEHSLPESLNLQALIAEIANFKLSNPQSC